MVHMTVVRFEAMSDLVRTRGKKTVNVNIVQYRALLSTNLNSNLPQMLAINDPIVLY